jgi:hypothetical protein
MKRQMFASWLKPVIVLLSAWLCVESSAQIRSVTLGIRTHCPYGIRGCWPEIRDGLEAPSEITSIEGEPDATTDTCELKMRDDWTADPELFQQNFTNMRIGVDVRGVEIVADGYLERDGKCLVIKIDGNNAPIELAPLKQKVQWDRDRKKPQSPTRAEREAFAKLKSHANRKPVRIRVVGPLVHAGKEKPGILLLHVRKFEVINVRS